MLKMNNNDVIERELTNPMQLPSVIFAMEGVLKLACDPLDSVQYNKSKSNVQLAVEKVLLRNLDYSLSFHSLGEVIKSKDKCKDCNGNKTVEESKILDVFVDKGMANGQKITFESEGDQIPDVIPGMYVHFWNVN